MRDLKDIAIRHVQDYLQGTKTIHELKTDIDKTPEFRHISDSIELPNKLLTHVNLGAFNCNELFELPNSSATRQGLIHILESFMSGHLTAIEINDWADNQICWEIGKGQEDLLVDGIVGEFAMYEDYINKYLTTPVLKRFISMLKTKRDDNVESALQLLSYEDCRNAISFLLTEYKNGQTINLTKFLQDNFQADIDNFILKDIFKNASADKNENLKLLDKLYV
ncbi:MAG: hypothetical protein IPN29_10010 [Saprospiraceae bacterium]|nr:hypothetical protein [Saprospiraceae bacterium]